MSDSIFGFAGETFAEWFLVVAIGVLLISSVALLLSKCFGRSAALRHLMLASALTSCLFLPCVASICSMLGFGLILIPINQRSNPVEQKPLVAEPIPQSSMRSRPSPSSAIEATVTMPVIATRAPDINRPRIDQQPVSTQSPPAIVDLPTMPATPPEPATAATSSGPSALAICATVWLVGAVLMLLRLLADCAYVLRIRRSATLTDGGQLLSDVVAELGVQRQPILLTSNRIVVPMAVGFGRPAVVFPAKVLGSLSQTELRDVLLHEVAHLRRGDHVQVLWQRLAGVLYWPVVTVHLLNHHLQRAREELCDNIVLHSRDAIAYGNTLLKIAESLVETNRLSVGVGMIRRPGELELRIAGLLDSTRNRETTVKQRATCAVAVMCLIVVSAFATIRTTSTVQAAGRMADDQTDAATGRETSPLESSSKRAKIAAGLRQPYEREGAFPKLDLQRLVKFSGHIVGPDGRGVVGAKLYVSADSWTDPIEVGTSVSDGTYHFDVPERDLRRYMDGSVRPDLSPCLIVIADGFGADWTNLATIDHQNWQELHANYVHDFRLIQDQPITGHIHAADGSPIVGASVSIATIFELREERWQTVLDAWKSATSDMNDLREIDPLSWQSPLFRTAWQMHDAVHTDANGRFVLAGVGRNRVATLQIIGPGIRSTKVSVVTRPDVSEVTQLVRETFPRTRQPQGVYYPPRKEDPPQIEGVMLFDSTVAVEIDPARTISGVIVDASSKKPIPNVRVTADFMSEFTDRHGRYHIVRGEDRPGVWLFASPREFDRYMSVVNHVDNAAGLGHHAADINLVPGTVVMGQVVETGSDRPIVSSPRSTCHAPWPGVMTAGFAYYYPLGTNTSVRDTAEGLYFAGGPDRATNYYSSATIGADGRFQVAVPPGPGVVMVIAAPGAPMFFEMGVWHEAEGFHRLFPYRPLAGRQKNDGAPEGDADSLPGLSAPILLQNMHAYRIISPAPGEPQIDLTMTIARAPTVNLHFVLPDGSPAKDVMVKGLVASESPLTVVLAGSDAQAVSLAADQPRVIVAVTTDGKYVGHASITVDDPQPRSIPMELAASVSGRLVDAADDRPLADFDFYLRDPDPTASLRNRIQCSADGRFAMGSLLASNRVSISIQAPRDERKGAPGEAYQPDGLLDLELRPGQQRDLGDVRVKLATGK